MKKACLYVNDFFVRDEIFNRDNQVLNRNNLLEPFISLKEDFRRCGYEIRTQDFHDPNDSEFTIYIDMPKRLPDKRQYDRSYLLLFETPLIRSDNWDLNRHLRFRKVFTWSESHLRMSDRYIKINFPQPAPYPEIKTAFQLRKKLCCIVSGGKLSLHSKELYSERIRWIRWFEKNHPSDFDLYGSGWDRMWMTGPIWIRAINKLPLWRKMLFPGFASLKGAVDDKYGVLSSYKFSICLENARDLEGYITEKIFDCFFSRCIPIYLGAPDIAEKIPSDCFIDLRGFKSREHVYERISTMREEEFAEYQQNIDNFLRSDRFSPFTSQAFIKTLAEHCIVFGS